MKRFKMILCVGAMAIALNGAAYAQENKACGCRRKHGARRESDQFDGEDVDGTVLQEYGWSSGGDAS